jgi:phosphohistidine swiveling domain-containing protein
MATVHGIDDFVTDEWYPGFTPSFDHSPYVVEPFRTFRKQDEERFWFLDFHWARGLTPMGLIWNEDGYSWGTQFAAEQMPLPSGRGITQRIAGTHTYAAPIAVRSEQERIARTRRMRDYLPGFLDNFDTIWSRRRDEIEAGWQQLRSIDVEKATLGELGELLVDARAFHRRSFEIHFEVMYPLLANYLGFRGLCTELGIDPDEIGKFLQGYDTKIMQTDRALWSLTAAARAAGLESVFAATPVDQLAAALGRQGGAAAGWLVRFGEFLAEYGNRTEGTSDIAMASWIEDPTPPLGMIKTFLQKPREHDFAAALACAVSEREAAVDAARSRLTRAEQRIFDAGLASVQAANFPWWQDEHNYYIDLRAALPMRWAALQIAERVGADRPDDTLFLFWPELTAVADGRRRYGDYRSLVEVRRQYFDHWHDRRAEMPKVLGTVPDEVTDPILIEVFGLNRHFLATVKAASTGTEVTTLSGVPAARGLARGVARVVRESADLHLVQPGEVLVCESTSPSWTPAFAKIAACVCDGGGTLSHAAIVGREYGVPTVTACGLATSMIATGDEVEVDGSRGVVTIFRPAIVADSS